MKNIFREFTLVLLLVVFVLLPMGCREDNFIEPPDPFEQGRLEPNPAVIQYADPNNPFAIETNHANLSKTSVGLRIQGSVYTKNETYGDMRLVNGDFVFLNESAVKKLGKVISTEHGDLPLTLGKFQRVTADSIETYSAMAAYGMMELPAYGLLSKITAPLSGGDLAGAKVTIGYGSKIKETYGSTFAPLSDSRNYFVFQMETGVGFDIGAVSATVADAFNGTGTSVGIGNASSYIMVIDPTDPFLYYVGGLGGLSFGGIEDGGFGFSVGGNMNYVPRVNIYDRIKSFDNGYIYLLGDIPIPFPIANVNPTISGAEAVIRFEKGDFGAPIGFFDLLPVRYIMGLNGSLTVNPDIIPGFLSLTFEIGNASAYINYNKLNDFTVSFVGVMNSVEVPDPNVIMLDLTGNILKKLGLPKDGLKLIEYIKMSRAAVNPTSLIKENATFMATLSSRPKEWDFGLTRKSTLQIPGIGEIASGEMSLRMNPDLFRYNSQVDIGPFAGMEILGEVLWSEGADFTLKGHAWTDIGGEWGPVGFKLEMELLAEIYKRDLVFGFHGLINLDGKFWVTILKKRYTAGAKFRLETRIQSDGTFQLSFRIGIGPFGYTVHIDYSNGTFGQMKETITMKEIPINQVPPEHRYTPEEGPILLPAGYVHDYQTELTTERSIIMKNQ